MKINTIVYCNYITTKTTKEGKAFDSALLSARVGKDATASNFTLNAAVQTGRMQKGKAYYVTGSITGAYRGQNGDLSYSLKLDEFYELAPRQNTQAPAQAPTQTPAQAPTYQQPTYRPANGNANPSYPNNVNANPNPNPNPSYPNNPGYQQPAYDGYAQWSDDDLPF